MCYNLPEIKKKKWVREQWVLDSINKEFIFILGCDRARILELYLKENQSKMTHCWEPTLFENEISPYLVKDWPERLSPSLRLTQLVHFCSSAHTNTHAKALKQHTRPCSLPPSRGFRFSPAKAATACLHLLSRHWKRWSGASRYVRQNTDCRGPQLKEAPAGKIPW